MKVPVISGVLTTQRVSTPLLKAVSERENTYRERVPLSDSESLTSKLSEPRSSTYPDPPQRDDVKT